MRPASLDVMLMQPNTELMRLWRSSGRRTGGDRGSSPTREKLGQDAQMAPGAAGNSRCFSPKKVLIGF